jgi:hypothetical protein
LRQLNFAPLLELADRFKARKLGASVQSDDFGSVVMVAAPYFENNEWTGLVVASFDPRNLLSFSPDPGALTVLSSDGTLWPGGGNQGGEALTGVKWEELLKDSVQGEMSMGGGTLVWLSRYLGQLHVIYLTEVVHESAKAAKAEPKPADAQAPADEAPKSDAAGAPDAAQPAAPETPAAPANP